MPQIYDRANGENGNGALPNRFGVGFGTRHGYYWELDLRKDDQTLRQEIVQFVNRTTDRTYQVQLDLWNLQFFYVNYDGSFMAFHANTVQDACTYIQNRFIGRTTAYMYVWYRRNLSLDNFKDDGKIKQELCTNKF